MEGGTQNRTYSITTPAQYGGTSCPISPEERSCNTQTCDVVSDDGGVVDSNDNIRLINDINSEWCPDFDDDTIIGVNDLLSLLGSYGDSCNGNNQNKCSPSKRGGDENINVNELLILLSKFGLSCDESPDCSLLQNNIESMRGVRSVFRHHGGGQCNIDSCEVLLTCNSDTNISTNFSCNSGIWTHQGTSEQENSISECIGN